MFIGFSAARAGMQKSRQREQWKNIFHWSFNCARPLEYFFQSPARRWAI
jgi:hypothetical protein